MLALVAAQNMSAQLSGDGFYRVQNASTERYISVIDNKGEIYYSAYSADLYAIKTIKNFSNVVSDPGSVIYFKQVGDDWNLKTQGTDTYSIIGFYITVKSMGNNKYRTSATKAGATLYLSDDPSYFDTQEQSQLVTNTTKNRDWYVKPVTQSDDNYFGVSPTVTAGDKYYASFYAGFPFTCASDGMKVCYVEEVSGNYAIYSEISGEVAESTPVFIECSSSDPASNKLDIHENSASTPSSNQLTGVYFNIAKSKKHTNRVAYDANTMRVLGTTSDGSIGYITASDLDYIPANTAYLTVPEGTAAELKLVTRDEYTVLKAEEEAAHEAEMAKGSLTITANSYTITYGDSIPAELAYNVEATDGASIYGVPVVTCSAADVPGAGTYDIIVSIGSVENKNVTLVNGTLTVNKASLTVTAGTYTKEQGQENPEFTLTYDGFVNNDTEASLTTLPTATTTATTDSEAGQYEVTVSGGESANYEFTYVNGTLTITEPAGISNITIDGKFDVYNTAGYKVRKNATTLEGLPKGVYIINGKKAIIK